MVGVLDKQTGTIELPHAVPHVVQAKRWFKGFIQNPDTKYGKNPEDFNLVHLGTFDPVTGRVENLQAPEQLASGV